MLELKTIKEMLKFVENIINTLRDTLITLDHNLRVVIVNRSFYTFFKSKPENTIGQLIFELGNRQWDTPALRELLKTTLQYQTSFDTYEVDQDFADIGRRVMLLNARQIDQAEGKEHIILLTMEDITERADELVIAKKEKIKRADELVIAQEEKGKRADELVIAQEEKGKRADELVIAEEEKGKREDELVIANNELAFQNKEKDKRADELRIVNEEKEHLLLKLKRAASVFSHAHEGIMITDATGTITEVNDTFSHITGYHSEEVLGQNPRMLKLAILKNFIPKCGLPYSHKTIGVGRYGTAVKMVKTSP